LYFGTNQLFFTNDPDEAVFGFPEQPVDENQSHPLAPIAGLSSRVARTTTVKSPINLNRVSLQLIPREEPGTFNVQFILDASSPCTVRVFYFANEHNLPTEGVPSYAFEAGLGQLVVTGDDGVLNINDGSEDDLKGSDENHTYPVIISIEALPGDECEGDTKEKKNCIANYNCYYFEMF